MFISIIIKILGKIIRTVISYDTLINVYLGNKLMGKTKEEQSNEKKNKHFV